LRTFTAPSEEDCDDAQRHERPCRGSPRRKVSLNATRALKSGAIQPIN
jgi:hypothetical protein